MDTELRTLQRNISDDNPHRSKIVNAARQRAGLLPENPMKEWIKRGPFFNSWLSHEEDETVIYIGYSQNSGYGYSADSSVHESNAIVLDSEFGCSSCHCEVLELNCNCTESDKDQEACSFYSSPWNSPRGFLVLEDPCECGKHGDEPWACERVAMDIVDSLEEYLVLDEDIMFQWEHAEIVRRWNDYARSDFLRVIHEEEEIDLESTFSESRIDEVYHDTCREFEVYAIYEGSSINWPWQQDDEFILAFLENLEVE